MRRSIYTLCKSDLTPLLPRLPSITLPSWQQRRQRQQQREQQQRRTRLQQQQQQQRQQQQTRLREQQQEQQQLIQRQEQRRQCQMKLLQSRRATLYKQQPREERRVADQSLSERIGHFVGNLDDCISSTTFVIKKGSEEYPISKVGISSIWNNVGPGRTCVASGTNTTRKSNSSKSPLRHSGNNSTRNNSVLPIVQRNGISRAAVDVLSRSVATKDAIGKKILNIPSSRTTVKRRQNTLKEEEEVKGINCLRNNRSKQNSNGKSNC